MGTSQKAVTVIAVEAVAEAAVGLAGLTAKPADSESEYITARDEAYGRPKQTELSRPGGSSR